MFKPARILAPAALLMALTGQSALAQQPAPQAPSAPAAREAFRGLNIFEVVVRAPTGWRQYEVRRQLDLAVGEQLHFYAEPVGFGMMDREGQRLLRLRVGYEFVDARGQIVYKSPNPRQIHNDFAANTTNIHLRLAYRVPELTTGAYTLKAVLQDGFNDRLVTIERRVTIGAAREQPAPQAAPAQPRPAPPQAQAPAVPPPQAQPPVATAPGIAADNFRLTDGRATGFRQFKARDTHTYAPGEHINMYFEPRNARTRFDGRAITGGLTVDLTVATPNGQVVGNLKSLWKLPIMVEASQDGPLQGLFVTLGTGLNLTAGSYRLTLRVNDDVGGGFTELTIDIQIQGAAVPPQAQAPTPAPQPTPATQAPAQPGSHLPRTFLQRS